MSGFGPPSAQMPCGAFELDVVMMFSSSLLLGTTGASAEWTLRRRQARDGVVSLDAETG
jgi:hypothetical protein